MLRSWKGRSAILCETKTGIKILKEYKGGQERLLIQKQLLEKIKEKGFYKVEDIISTKEGELIAKDEDMNSYYLKEYSSGKECNIRESFDIGVVTEQMALLHNAMEQPELIKEKELIPYSLPKASGNLPHNYTHTLLQIYYRANLYNTVESGSFSAHQRQC